MTDAISDHQKAVDEAARKVYEHLKKHNPEVLDLLRKPDDGVTKDMTASDVHATTALGNQKGSKKISFAEALKNGKAAKTPKAVPDKGVATDEDMTKADTEWTLPLEIIKAEPEQRLIFGWASIATKDGQIVVDKQNDMIMPEDLERAAYDFVLYCRTGADMHKQDDKGEPVQVSRLVESMMFTKEKQDILKIDLGLEGWWVGFKVDDPKLWEMHKSGKRPEFSIGGRGRRVAV